MGQNKQNPNVDVVLAQVNLPAREQQHRHHEDGEYEPCLVHHGYQLLHSFPLAGIKCIVTLTRAVKFNICHHLLLGLGLNSRVRRD